MSDEIVRIRQIYDTHYRQTLGDYTYIWHARNPVSYTYRQARERAIIGLFNRHQVRLEEAKVLDVGCGSGDFLRFLTSLSDTPENLYGVDLMEYRIESARKVCSAAVHLYCQDAQRLPFEADTFDMVSQFTMFSSILEDAVQRTVAAEIDRVLKKSGLILWYDMKDHQPVASNIQGISQARLAELFPAYEPVDQELLHHRWIYRLAHRSWLLCELVERMPGLPHTHILALLKKQ